MFRVLDSSGTTHYTLNMKRGKRYIGIIDNKRYWRALNCGHPVSHYYGKWCKPCWFKSEDREKAITKKRNYTISGQNHHSWKGGKIVNTGGYVEIRINGKYYLQHRLVMEESLGRKLKTGEEIHHINHDKTDNRIENLILFASHSEHIAFEHKKGDRKI